MADKFFPHRFLAIEGNIGAGKTTLAEKLAQDFDLRLILEEFSDNPFLPYFYDNPERYAFPVELFFMTERHKQLQQELSQVQLFNEQVVADYYFVKTLLFARNNLIPEEYRLFQRLFHILKTNFPAPDLLVYLHRSVPRLQQQINQRGRSFEQRIRSEYLQQIQRAYFEFFRSENSLPILILDVEDIDFVENPDEYDQLVTLISQEYQAGVHRLAVASK